MCNNRDNNQQNNQPEQNEQNNQQNDEGCIPKSQEKYYNRFLEVVQNSRGKL
ncbi:MAG: hypothetical protein N2247_01770 [Leptospiraceae bacterium]|nr:hypothetical protein [Leptospiraceae bacterium]